MKEIVSYAFGSFTDFKGEEHGIVVCGVTYPANENDYIDIDEDLFNIAKVLKIGVAICNPKDQYTSQKGEAIAYNRAKSYKAIVMTSSRPGMFNTESVNAIIFDYLRYIERDPGSVIRGYDDACKRFKLESKLKEEASKMNDEDKQFIKKLAKVSKETLESAKKISKFL